MATAPSAILFEDILDFLASTPTPELIIAFEPSEILKQRLAHLLEQNRRDSLSVDERTELDEFLRMNHFMNMLKIRAREKLAWRRNATQGVNTGGRGDPCGRPGHGVAVSLPFKLCASPMHWQSNTATRSGAPR